MPTLLTLADAARELNASERQILRLVGLALLPASRVGGDELRIAEADFVAYVRQGAPNLMPASFNPTAGYPETKGDNFHALKLQERVGGWLVENAPAETEVRRWSTADPTATSFDYSASGLPADLQATFRQPAPFGTTGKAEPWVLRWGRDTLRQVSCQVIRDLYPSERNPFDALYRSPEQFQAIERETFQRAAARPMMTVQTYHVPPTPRRAGGLILVNLILPQEKLFALLPRSQWTAATW